MQAVLERASRVHEAECSLTRMLLVYMYIRTVAGVMTRPVLPQCLCWKHFLATARAHA